MKRIAVELFDQADVVEGEFEKVLALTTLCRTMGNFAGALLLLNKGFVVEARTLARCCFENLIWVDGLAAKGTKFIEEVVGDEYTSKISRGQSFLSWASLQPEQQHFEEQVQKLIEEIKKEHPKRSG